MEQELDLDVIEEQLKDHEQSIDPWAKAIISLLIYRLKLKGKTTTMSSTNLPKSLGTYEFERSTARFHVYARINEQGIKESQYVNKRHFDDKPPKTLEFFIKW